MITETGDSSQRADNSCIQGEYSGYGSQNITNNPFFYDLDNNDVHLMRKSPCINAGIESAAAVGLDWTDGYGTDPDGIHGDADMVNVGYHYPGYTLSSTDTDADGLPDWWELQYFGSASSTNTADGDYDMDNITNVEEYYNSTDPTDRYSVPELDMLSASGPDIVDAAGNPVVLRGINIGGWLGWEQWMLMFEPSTVTNYADEVVVNGTDEAEMQEWLMANLDGAVTLMAADATVKYNVNPETTPWTYLCPANIPFIGGFDNGDYIGFANVDFGSGVSNLAVSLAVPNSEAGKQIQVRLGGPTGTIIGTLTTKGTSPDVLQWYEWYTFSDQYITLNQTISGTQAIYFVGVGGSGIANILRFRFFRDPVNTREVIRSFQDNYFVTNDLDRIRSLGYNCIRLPFFYHLLEDDSTAYSYKTSGWARLDWVLEECAKRSIYCLLDLHGAPGGVNPWHSCGERMPLRNRLWGIEEFKDRTEKLWGEIAARYAANPAVIGYDLINEPYPPLQAETTFYRQQAFSNDILPLMSRLHKAVRSNDTDHIIFMEGNIMYTNMWDDIHWWPTPEEAGWTNVCYEFHNYKNVVAGWGTNDMSFTNQKVVCDANVRGMTTFRKEHNVPVFLGEFQPGDPENHDYTYQRYTAAGINWSHWNFRSFGWMDDYRPNRGWTGWGLDYRSAATKDLMPNLQTDSLETLTNRMALFTHTNYVAHEHLEQVVRNTSDSDNSYTELYLNTFNSGNGANIFEGWPWQKMAGVGNVSAFQIAGQEAKLKLDIGPVVMRYKSRIEADARFQVNDADGCWFEFQPCRFDVLSVGIDPEAELRFAIVRDEITNTVKQCSTPGLITIMEYDADAGSTTVNFSVYRKTGGTDTYGDQLFSIADVAFSTNALQMHVTSNSMSLIYNGTTHFTTNSHGLDINAWPEGAICVVEAEDKSGNTEFAYLDNFKAWRTQQTYATSYDGVFTNAPDGMMLRAWMEDVAVHRNWSTLRDTSTYVTNGRVLMIPDTNTYGSTWLNARSDFQNDLRLDVSTGGVAEIRISLRDYTQGWTKIGFLPEYFPGGLYSDYDGHALYLQLDRGGVNVNCTAYRQFGLFDGGRDDIGNSVSRVYANNQDVTVQVNTNWIRVYYDNVMIVNTTHGLTDFNAVYPYGIHPHVEFQSNNSSQGYVLLNYLRCRIRDDFGTPE